MRNAQTAEMLTRKNDPNMLGLKVAQAHLNACKPHFKLSFGSGAATSASTAHTLQSGRSAYVKSFGRRQAYESRRGTNPRAAGDGLWGIRFPTGSDARATGGGTCPSRVGGAGG